MKDQKGRTSVSINLIKLLSEEFDGGGDHFIDLLTALTHPPYWLPGNLLHWWKEEDGSFLLSVVEDSRRFTVRFLHEEKLSTFLVKFENESSTCLDESLIYDRSTTDSIKADLFFLVIEQRWKKYLNRVEKMKEINKKRQGAGMSPLSDDIIMP